MASVAPSSTLLNARLTSEKIALEEKLRAVTRRNRDLEQSNANLADCLEEKDEMLRDLRAIEIRRHPRQL